MIAPEEASVLADLRDALQSGDVLHSLDDCEIVARGFVACNVTLDLAEFLASLAARSEEPVAGRITYRRLHEALLDPDQRTFTQLVDLLAVEEQMSLRNFHPWSCIHRWLAVESMAPPPQTPEATTPSQIAREIFLEALSCDLSTETCRNRSRPVIDEFDRWWQKMAGTAVELTGNLRSLLVDGAADNSPRLTDLSPGNVREVLVRSLAESLESETMTALTAQKNEQLRACIARENRGVGLPEGVPSGWIVHMHDALEAAAQERHDLTLSRQNHEVLRKLLQWMGEHELAARHGVRLPNLHGVAESLPPVTVFFSGDERNFSLAAIAYEWDELASLVRKRRLPANWADYPQVSDMFSHPLMGDFRFGAWRRQALAAGLREEGR